MSRYNQWYNYTYEEILNIAQWNNFDIDIEKKIVCIFSWMPCAIMNISHSGKGENKVTKAQKYDLKTTKEKIISVKSSADYFSGKKLIETDIKKESVKSEIIKLSEPLVEILGTVGASKFLHFSFPLFFIMWDRKIRTHFKLPDDNIGYYSYLLNTIEELKKPEIVKIANEKYSKNLLRGLDIYRMEIIGEQE